MYICIERDRWRLTYALLDDARATAMFVMACTETSDELRLAKLRGAWCECLLLNRLSCPVAVASFSWIKFTSSRLNVTDPVASTNRRFFDLFGSNSSGVVGAKTDVASSLASAIIGYLCLWGVSRAQYMATKTIYIYIQNPTMYIYM